MARPADFTTPTHGSSSTGWTVDEEPSENRETGRDAESIGEPPFVGAVFRAARKYHGWSLREVERRIGRDNAYLSQVERGVIRRPDPLVLIELADLYQLNLQLVVEWAGLTESVVAPVPGSDVRDLVKAALQLEPAERAKALSFIEELLHSNRT